MDDLCRDGFLHTAVAVAAVAVVKSRVTPDAIYHCFVDCLLSSPLVLFEA